jgi:hypothetical protein
MRRTVLLVVLTALAAPWARAQPAAYAGFDRNDYPGDAALPELRKHFAFTGYWLTNPPGETHNTWVGKRTTLLRQGFGFLVVANGRLDKEILRSMKQGKPAAMLAQQDAATVVAAARREGFPPRTILFLDQEEGGVLLPEQTAYLLAWTEAVADSDYLPGVYASGQPVPNGQGADGRPATITTIQDIRARVAAGHLHEVAFWVAQDACPPAPGCVVQPPPPELSRRGARTSHRPAARRTTKTVTATRPRRRGSTWISARRRHRTPPMAVEFGVSPYPRVLCVYSHENNTVRRNLVLGQTSQVRPLGTTLVRPYPYSYYNRECQEVAGPGPGART